MSKMKKKVLLVVGIVLLIGLAFGAKYLVDLQNYKNEVAIIQFDDIDLSQISDGSYLGSYDVKFIKTEVKVEVKDHKIQNIELLRHENGKGAPAEAIIPAVIEAQSLDVDAISGATNSCKVILKSIELALESAVL